MWNSTFLGMRRMQRMFLLNRNATFIEQDWNGYFWFPIRFEKSYYKEAACECLQAQRLVVFQQHIWYIFLILSKIEGSSSSLSQFRIDSIPASYISTVVIVLGNVTKCILSYVYAWFGWVTMHFTRQPFFFDIRFIFQKSNLLICG